MGAEVLRRGGEERKRGEREKWRVGEWEKRREGEGEQGVWERGRRVSSKK